MTRRTARPRPSRRAVSRRWTLLLLAMALAVALAGCVSLPEGGAVQSGPSPDQGSPSDAPFDYTPSGPGQGAGPAEIVDGFLQAMTATPVSISVASRFLTDSAVLGWVPDTGTVVYGSETSALTGRFVTVNLGETLQLGSRGEWLGNTSGGRDLHYRIELVRENGQWRINNPPNALIVPHSHFESRFQQYFLYFFDKSAQILVPEPVYLPRGEQAPTRLLQGLLRGPDQDLLGTERTFIPANTGLEISVPVQRDGTAEVPLSDEILDLGDDDLDLALAQLAQTLKQVSGIQRMRITVDGSPMDIPGRGTEQDLAAWAEFDPAVNWASQELFGIRQGRVVNLLGDRERAISGLFGSESYGLRSIAVDLPAQQVAGVSASGTRVVVAPRTRESGEAPTASSAKLLYSKGTDLLKPSWDLYGQLWLLDRGRKGAVLTVLRNGVARELDAPHLSGENVTAFVLSPDGTRLVAVIDGPDFDRLVVSRVVRKDDGTVRRVAPATGLPVGGIRVHEIRDLAWRTPGSLALLAGPMPGLSQVIIALIDGSSALGDVATNAEIFRDEASRIVTAPSAGSSLFVGTTKGQLFQLAANGRWTGTSVKGGLASPTYVG